MIEPRARFARTSADERTDLASAFAPALFDPSDPPAEARHPGALPDGPQALLAGTTTVRPVRSTRRGGGGGGGYAVASRSRGGAPAGPLTLGAEGIDGDPTVLAVFEGRAEASLVASVLPAAAIENPFAVGDRERRRGHPVFQDGLLLGHVAHPDTELPSRLHLAYTYAANLEALAHLLEGLEARALVFLGRVLARRLEEDRRAGG